MGGVKTLQVLHWKFLYWVSQKSLDQDKQTENLVKWVLGQPIDTRECTIFEILIGQGIRQEFSTMSTLFDKYTSDVIWE